MLLNCRASTKVEIVLLETPHTRKNIVMLLVLISKRSSNSCHMLYDSPAIEQCSVNGAIKLVAAAAVVRAVPIDSFHGQFPRRKKHN